MKRITAFACAVLLSSAVSYAADTAIADNAADYIAERAHSGKKTRLALYPFTSETGESPAQAKVYTTRIMEKLIAKGVFKIIDPDKVAAVVEEQEKGLTGLVDLNTAPETGKMIGADALIFGIVGKNNLAIRMIDATTSEVIGATVKEDGGKASVQNDNLSGKSEQNTFLRGQVLRNLTQIANTKPLLFIHATANAEEQKKFAETHPGIARDMDKKNQQGDQAKNRIFTERKVKLMEMRKNDPALNKAIIAMRERIISTMGKRPFPPTRK